MSTRKSRSGMTAALATVALVGAFSFAATPAVAADSSPRTAVASSQSAGGPVKAFYLGWDACDDSSIGLIGGLGGMIAVGFYCLYR